VPRAATSLSLSLEHNYRVLTLLLTRLLAPPCAQMAMIGVSNGSAAALEAAVEEGNHALALNTSLCASISFGGTMAPEEDACNIVTYVTTQLIYVDNRLLLSST
jgi:hypothetical protein